LKKGKVIERFSKKRVLNPNYKYVKLISFSVYKPLDKNIKF